MTIWRVGHLPGYLFDLPVSKHNSFSITDDFGTAVPRETRDDEWQLCLWLQESIRDFYDAWPKVTPYIRDVKSPPSK